MDASTQSLTIEQLLELRTKTEQLSSYFQDCLRRYLKTLQPLFLPSRLLGQHVRGGKEQVPGSEQAFLDLQRMYRETCKSIGLAADLDEESFRFVGGRVEVYPWQYSHPIVQESGEKIIVISSPIEWVMTYGSGVTLAEIRKLARSKTQAKSGELSQFVLSALAMHLFLKKFSDVRAVLEGLRYSVDTRTSPELGDLPLTTIKACLTSFRPSDGLLAQATNLSGVPAFIELVEIEQARNIVDPLKAEVAKRL